MWIRISTLFYHETYHYHLRGLVNRIIIIIAIVVSFPSFANYDFSFVRNKQEAEAFLSGLITKGEYLVNISLNGERYGKSKLYLSKVTNKDEICVPRELIAQSDLPINLTKIQSVYNGRNQCYNIYELKYSSSELDINTLTLNIGLPQAYLKNNNDDKPWNYGETGAILNYYLRSSNSWGKKNNKDHDSQFGSFDMHFNHDRWVLSSSFDIYSGKSFDGVDLKLSTAIREIKGDLSFGKLSTRSAFTPDFYYQGVAITSNQAMKEQHFQVYAPSVSGTLIQTSTITLKQGGRTLYSKTLPPGEYIINDYYPVNNGDIEVIIEGEDGTTRNEILNVSITPGLLKEDDINYSFALGEKESDVNGIFAFGDISYGYDIGTISLNGLVHSKYHNFGLGFAMPLGWMGALSTNVNLSTANYDSKSLNVNGKESQNGISFGLNYAKDISDTTNLQLLTYRYQDENYIDFSEFDPDKYHIKNRKKSRYEASLRHKIGDAHLTSTLWLQEYRNKSSTDSGANITLSKTFPNNVSLNIQGYYQNNSMSEAYGTSIGVSIPFDMNNNKQFSTSSLSYDSGSGAAVTSSVSVRTDESLSYNLNTSYSENGNYSTSINSNIKTSYSQVSLGATTTNNSNSVYMNASGTIGGAKGAGLVWGPNHANTISIAHTKNLEGIKFKNAIEPTNKYGNTIVSLSEYRENSISLDNNSSVGIEFLNSSDKVVPTSSAIIVNNVDYVYVKRYFLQLFIKDGSPIQSGLIAKDDNGSYVGTTSSDGVLVATILNDTDHIKVGDDCTVELGDIEKNKRVIHEAVCM